MTVRTLPSVVYLTNFQLLQSNRLLTVSGWEDKFRRICGPDTQSNASVNTSNTEYSSINSLDSAENNEASQDRPYNDSLHISTDSEDDNIICDISIQADQARLYQAKRAYDLVLGKTDASLVKKFLTTSDAPHLDTKALIQKLDEVAKKKHRNEVPLGEWQNETVPFRSEHIDHKGPLHPTSANNVHCLLLIDAFSQFLIVYPLRNTTALATITAVERWIPSLGIPQSIIHDRGTAFIITEFINWTKELGITLRPTAHSSSTNGKIETQNQHIARYWRNFLNDAGNNWSSLAPKFAFAHNTNVKYTTGKTPYEIVFRTKPQIPMSLKLGLYRHKHKLCCSNFPKDLPSHSNSENSLKNELLDNLLQPQLSQALIERERNFKQIYSSTFADCTIPRLSQSIQAGTPPRDRTESTL